MKRKKQADAGKRKNNTQLIVSLLFLLAIAVAPILRGLYREQDYFFISAVVLGCCLVFLLLNRRQLQFDYIDGLLLLLCISFLLSLFNAVNIREAYLGMVKMLTYFSCYYIVRQCFQQQEEKTAILKAIVFSLTTVTVLTILTRIGIIHFPGAIDGIRFSGTLQYANTFAAMMMLVISLTYYLDLSAEEKQRPIFLIINYINTVAFFSSASRGALLIYLPLILFYLFYWRNKERFFIRLSLVNVTAIITSALMFKLNNWQISFAIMLFAVANYLLDKLAARISARMQILITTCAIALGGGLVLFFASGSTIARLAQINFGSTSAVARFIFYLDALKVFQTSPLIGHGADSWEYLYRSIQTYYYNSKLVHSNLFQLLVEVGLLGTITYYSSFVVVGLKNMKALFLRDKQLEVVVLITLIAVQLHALIDFDFSMPAMVFIVFVLLGLIAGDYEKGIISARIMKIPLILLTLLSFISVVSFLVGAMSVDRVIAEIKDGKVQVDKIGEYQNKMKLASYFDPFNSFYRDYLGQFLIAKGMEKKDESIIANGLKEIDHAIKLSPYDYNLYADKGKMLAQLERYEEASDCYKQIIDLMPYHQGGYEGLIRAYTTLAFEEKDVSYARESVEVYNLAKDTFYRIPEQYIKMIPEEDKLTNSGILNYQMGAACFLIENYEEGLKHFEVALKYFGKNNVTEEIKGWIVVGNQRLNRNIDLSIVNANPEMVQKVEKLINDFHQAE
jgi:tetratricopeptide (TPR) repeat protein